MIRLILIIYPGGGAHGVRAVTSGPLYRFFLGFECRKKVIGMVLDSEVPIAAGVEQLDRVRRTRRASVEKSK